MFAILNRNVLPELAENLLGSMSVLARLEDRKHNLEVTVRGRNDYFFVYTVAVSEVLTMGALQAHMCAFSNCLETEGFID
ncbi:MAG: hypothetical protein Q8S96_20105 [Hydrogenophaga sp.]|uniref:hypothetical protein n=1 Tax=Hydrogenophaga sp. TaxID=1904254 RepID=UPI00272247E9|nr:hypothetical protein [Hydrogenophaga sp.]MDO9479905.1 hypothetical protein [Hydrogenophaga sp.]MDP3346739.1 hypothetical protein [Hydrogenophaga sp.]MDP3806723.1 hypothetical protein [Hydrogenophaga sp.]MDP3922954.1 hypothetical protein [Hydrogenophaga sp.]